LTVIDTTKQVGPTVPFDLGAARPSDGTAVDVAGARTRAYRLVCTTDPDRDHVCDDDEVDRVEVGVFDPVSKRAVLVLMEDDPEFSAATLTGLLRREERAVDDAQTTTGLDYAGLDIDVSDRYVLDESVPPRMAPLAFALALVLIGVGAIILAGLAGGYLTSRRSGAALTAPARTLEPGDRLPLRVTGMVRTPTGLEHLREAPGDLVRFALGRRVPPPVESPSDIGPEATGNADGEPDSTLIVERRAVP